LCAVFAALFLFFFFQDAEGFAEVIGIHLSCGGPHNSKITDKDLTPYARTMGEIVEACIIYGRPREPKAFFELGEQGLMKKHLDRLMRLGKVFKEGDRYIKRTAGERGSAHVPDRK